MPISAEFPFPKQWIEVLGSKMAFVEAGTGDPIVLLHGNPTRRTYGATSCRIWWTSGAASCPI